nr:unnamed protein product [Callosobruchus analis]
MGRQRQLVWREALNALPMLQATGDSIEPTFVFKKPYKIEIKQNAEPNVSNAVCIYTDGSKTRKGAGCGVYSRSLKLRAKWAMDKNVSVVQTELAGISIAAKELTRKGISGKTVVICTDSRQALLTLKRPRVTSGLAMECHQSLTHASDKNNIVLRWVKGHNNNKGNRIADGLARKAADLKILGPCDLPGMSTTTIAETAKKNSHAQMVKRWEELRGCRFAKETLGDIDMAISKKYLAMNRSNLRLIVGFLTGHCQLRKHLHTMGAEVETVTFEDVPANVLKRQLKSLEQSYTELKEFTKLEKQCCFDELTELREKSNTAELEISRLQEELRKTRQLLDDQVKKANESTTKDQAYIDLQYTCKFMEEKYKTTLSSYETEIESLRSQLEDVIRAVETKNTELTTQVTELEAVIHSEMVDQKDTLSKLNILKNILTETVDVQGAETQTEETVNSLEGMEEELMSHMRYKAESSAIIRGLEDLLEENRRQYKFQISNYENRIQELQSGSEKQHSLTFQLAQLDKKLVESGDMELLKATIASLELENQSLNAIIDTLKQDVAEIQSANTRVEEVTLENEALKNQLAEYNTSIADLAKVTNERDSLQAQFTDLKRELEPANKKVEELTLKNDALIKSLAEFNTSVADLAKVTNERDTLQAHVKDLKMKLKPANKKVEELTLKNHALKESVADLAKITNERDTLQVHVTDLKRKLEPANKKVET